MVGRISIRRLRVSRPHARPGTTVGMSSEEPFRRNLAWSAGAHVLILAAVGIGLGAGGGGSLPLAASATFIELGMSGPNPRPNLGGSPPAPAPESTTRELSEPPPPATEPEPEPAADPPPIEAPAESGVARPTHEVRDRMPIPEARARRRPLPDPKPDSGLRGQDAAWADSAALRTSRPIDRSARPRRRDTAARSSTGPAGIGLGGAPGGSLFDQDFEYAYYQRQMIARIQAKWQQIPVEGQAKVVIAFTIHRDGSISSTEVENSSGHPPLDHAARRAVILAEPFPQLPDSYPRDRVGVHLLFTYGDTRAGPSGSGGSTQ